MKSYLISWLIRQYGGLDLEGFTRARPEDWLVWEAGPWRPPSRQAQTALVGARQGFASAESLAIVLAPGKGNAIRLGREATNDIVIDDATLSRTHLGFTRDAQGRWSVHDLGSSNGSRIRGQKLGVLPAPLDTGTTVEAGAVRLTFYDAAGLFLRLRGVPPDA